MILMLSLDENSTPPRRAQRPAAAGDGGEYRFFFMPFLLKKMHAFCKTQKEGSDMRNRLTVIIAGQEYNLLSTDDADYMRKVAEHVDEKVTEVTRDARVSLADAAVLAALNIADEYYKELAVSEHLRVQIKEYLEEATDLKMQLSEAKREIFKLQSRSGAAEKGKKS